jgi:nucleoside-diphosphate-sugar epimerase
MKVLVAGASGAVGTPVGRELVERGHDVVAMITTESKRPAVEALGVAAVVGDVLDTQAMIELVALG